MSAVYNAPENGEHSRATESLTSDKPQFDLKQLYSDTATANYRSNSSNENAIHQLDFDEPINFEQQSAMNVARTFASFDNRSSNNSGLENFDREDVGRMVEVFGDMLQMQNSIHQGDRKDASQWLGELRRDLKSFAKGVFDEPSGNDDCKHPCNDEDQIAEEYGPEEHGSHETGSENGAEKYCPENTTEESGTESGGESGTENCEGNIEYTGSGMEGYTPEDTMVLLSNDMQQLSSALASGDMEAAQRIMSRMNRHMSLLMQHLNKQNGEDDLGMNFDPDDPRNIEMRRPSDDFLRGRRPNDGPVARTGPGLDLGIDLPFPDLGIRNPIDSLPPLPNPGDIIGSLPQPPNPADIIGSLPQPPNPADIIGHLPQPPNPRDLLDNLFGGLF
jgi:hypothetical protein